MAKTTPSKITLDSTYLEAHENFKTLFLTPAAKFDKSLITKNLQNQQIQIVDDKGIHNYQLGDGTNPAPQLLSILNKHQIKPEHQKYILERGTNPEYIGSGGPVSQFMNGLLSKSMTATKDGKNSTPLMSLDIRNKKVVLSSKSNQTLKKKSDNENIATVTYRIEADITKTDKVKVSASISSDTKDKDVLDAMKEINLDQARVNNGLDSPRLRLKNRTDAPQLPQPSATIDFAQLQQEVQNVTAPTPNTTKTIENQIDETLSKLEINDKQEYKKERQAFKKQIRDGKITDPLVNDELKAEIDKNADKIFRKSVPEQAKSFDDRNAMKKMADKVKSLLVGTAPAIKHVITNVKSIQKSRDTQSRQ